MGSSMPIDRVDSASLLRGAAQPLVTANDDHLPEKISWQENEFSRHEPVELNHIHTRGAYFPGNFPSLKRLSPFTEIWLPAQLPWQRAGRR